MSVNHSIDNNIFPSTLKLANITPVFKKGSANSKENYRPVSILPNLSKIFERCMFKHMSNYFEEPFYLNINVVLGKASAHSTV